MKRKKKVGELIPADVNVEGGVAETPKEIEVARITFTFGMSKDEAEAILHKPKGSIARNMRKYMNSLVEHAARKFFEPEENVTDCKD